MTNDELKKAFAECIEEVAREYAAQTGFDMTRENHALFRMMMSVLGSEGLRFRAIEKLKAREAATKSD